MIRSISLLASVAVMVLTAACTGSSATSNMSGESSAMEAATYYAYLPCADCAGIATTLALDSNGTYSLAQRYLGKDKQLVSTSQGRYMVSGERLQLSPKPEDASKRPSQFRMVGQTLRQLDIEGQPVEGALASYYDFEKQPPLRDGLTELWVNHTRLPCTGVGPQTCYQIKEGNDVDAGEWTYFYDEIAGFDFVPGKVHHLVVLITELDPARVPADALSRHYELAFELETMDDPTLRLHNIWALTSLGGEEITVVEGVEPPVLELQVGERRAMGTDGCNQYMGAIDSLSEGNLRFGPLGGTKMACRDMTVSSAFNSGLAEVRGYRFGESNLVLLDEGGEEVMQLRPVD